mmetsp:Transcript_121714/g.190980  ORF Transcript_121714/g.190980 Transcript_121714/m.190980 type:complete len:398 (-) Transcript_121714:314-1507(-)
MVKVIAKNTFISFIVSGEQGEFADSAVPHSLGSRSRSAESVRNKSVHEELAQQSTQRLNAVLSVGMSSGACGRCDEETNESLGNAQIGGIVCLSELRGLHEKLGKALATTSFSLEDTKKSDRALKHVRNVSNCSLSTMAPEDASECGSLRGGLSRMRNVLSSGSVSTMASDWADCVSESGEDVAFELNVQEDPSTEQALVAWPDTDSDYEEAEVRLDIAQKAYAHPQPDNSPTLAAFASMGRYPTNREFSHGSVPRHRNWAAMRNESEKDDPPTTLMIRNVPSRFSQQDLVMELQDLGFAGTFDFLYIPMDKSTSANVGYAFVNFVAPSWAKKCMEIFQNHCFTRNRRGPTKVATVSVAHLQGLEKNLQHYENAAVNASKQTQRRPLVMTSIGKIVV